MLPASTYRCAWIRDPTLAPLGECTWPCIDQWMDQVSREQIQGAAIATRWLSEQHRCIRVFVGAWSEVMCSNELGAVTSKLCALVICTAGRKGTGASAGRRGYHTTWWSESIAAIKGTSVCVNVVETSPSS